MLQELAITDFAIIDNLVVPFDSGFCVLTGETGAGKSIIIDAVDAVLGGRISGEMVRTGARTARMEAIFTVDTPEIAEAVGHALEGFDLLDQDDASLILAREISAAGRSTARVNGRAVPVSVLAAVGELLVDIHGQGEHLSLFKVAGHVDLLDRFAGTLEQRRVVAALVHRLRAIEAEEARLRSSRHDAERRIGTLRFQIEEIEAAHLVEGEEAALEAERVVLANADRLATLGASAQALLSEGERGDDSATDLLTQAVQILGDLARVDVGQASLVETLQGALIAIDEVAHDLAHYRASIEADPGRLASLEERAVLLQALRRKYGAATVADLIAFSRASSAERDELLNAEDRLEELSAETERVRVEIGREAAALSGARAQAAQNLARRMEDQLNDLNMQRARFEVALERRADPGGVPVPGDETRVACDETGVDRVEFLVSPNPGEDLKPLARIASGGEASRLMLALKTILSNADRTPTLIFDEVDTGVGGRSAQVVGEKLRDLARAHQVLCITHLPQVAALGDEHLRVEKQIVDGRTRTVVSSLRGPERVREIAAMLGGMPVSDSTLRAAGDLIARANGQPTLPF
jgi:DNA repair protein RecN (Recombination protein N)